VGFWNAVTAWTGRQLFVTNGQEEPCLSIPGHPGIPANCWPHAGLYDPVTNRWTETKLPVPMYGLYLMAAVWNGRDVILAGVNHVHHPTMSVAAYDPATNHWRMITPRLPVEHPTIDVSLVATPGRVILWSQWDYFHHVKPVAFDVSGVDVLSLGPNGTWSNVTDHWPQTQAITAPVFTGSAILVSPSPFWCDNCSIPGPIFYPGYFADPVTLQRTLIPLGPLGQAHQAGPPFIWTGRTIIAINLNPRGGEPVLRRDDMALYDPATRRWQRLPAPPGRPTPAVTPIWAGNQLLLLSADGSLLWFHR
jgi:hypothetical protein